jgi:hypothetical protein
VIFLFSLPLSAEPEPKIGLTEQAILAIWLYVFERNKKDLSAQMLYFP